MCDQVIARCLSPLQLERITQKMLNQVNDYHTLKNTPLYLRVFSDEYGTHKRKHTLTWAVMSTFRSGRDCVAGVHVRKKVYGWRHTKPELYNDNVILHILNSTSDLKAKHLLKHYYPKNKDDFSGKPLYMYIYYEYENDRITFIDLRIPNSTGDRWSMKRLYTQPEVAVRMEA